MGKGNKPQKNDKASKKPKKVGMPVKKQPLPWDKDNDGM